MKGFQGPPLLRGREAGEKKAAKPKGKAPARPGAKKKGMNLNLTIPGMGGKVKGCLECGAPRYRDKGYCQACYAHVRRGIPTDARDVPTRSECEAAVDPSPLIIPRAPDPH